jgi:hypothetical protein
MRHSSFTIILLFAGCAGLEPEAIDDVPDSGATDYVAYGHGVTGTSRLWPNGRVPYRIDTTLLDQTRITDAIAEWETKTTLEFDPASPLDFDYIYFTNSDRCNSNVGRQGGRQDIELSSGKEPYDILGSSISNASEVYTWFDDGRVSVGTATDLDTTRAQYLYTPASGRTISQIRGIAISKVSAWVYAWYSDGTVSAGTSSDLDAYSAPQPFTMPAGKSDQDIAEIDMGPDGRVYTFYWDGTYSIGTTPTNLGTTATATYSVDGLLRYFIAGIAIGPTGDVFAWYSTGEATAGTLADFDVYREAFDFDTPVHCETSSVIHEMGHAIGLKHEHQRCDRDSYVRVFTNNIIPEKLGNFAIECGISYLPIGAYDLTSRMHYNETTFSANGLPTMLALVTPGATVPIGEFLDMSISPSSEVFTWWSDGYVTSGSSDDLESITARTRFTLPPDTSSYDYEYSSIIGVGISKVTGNTFTFYRNNTYSIGTPTDLDSVQEPRPTTYGKFGHDHWDVSGIDLAPNGRVYAWFRDGRMTIGDATDVGKFSSSTTIFHVDNNRHIDQVLGIAIGASGAVYAWYNTGDVSSGTSTDFDSDRDLYDFRSRLAELNPSDELTAGDVATVEYLY